MNGKTGARIQNPEYRRENLPGNGILFKSFTIVYLLYFAFILNSGFWILDSYNR